MFQQKLKCKFSVLQLWKILLYGIETWTPLQQDLCRLETFQMRCLRCIIGVSRWDHLYNLDIRAWCCEQLLVEALIRQRRLRWFGHVCRMDKQRLPFRLRFGRLSHSSRPSGAPRRRRVDVVSTDLKALHIENNWSILCQDRATWRQIVFSTRGTGRIVHQRRRLRTSSSTPSATDNYIGRRIQSWNLITLVYWTPFSLWQ